MTREQIIQKFGEPIKFNPYQQDPQHLSTYDDREYELFEINGAYYQIEGLPGGRDGDLLKFVNDEAKVQVDLDMPEEEYEKAPFVVAKRFETGMEGYHKYYLNDPVRVGRRELNIVFEDGSAYKIENDEKVLAVCDGRYIATGPIDNNDYSAATKIKDKQQAYMDAVSVTEGKGAIEFDKEKGEFHIGYDIEAKPEQMEIDGQGTLVSETPVKVFGMNYVANQPTQSNTGNMIGALTLNVKELDKLRKKVSDISKAKETNISIES